MRTFIVREGDAKYRVMLRGCYSQITSEKKLRDAVRRGIDYWQTKNPEYAEALRKKSLFEVCRLFGLITAKWRL